MYIRTARSRQKPRLRRRRQNVTGPKRAGLAFLLLGGSVTSHSVDADTVKWTLAADGLWNVAANWAASTPPTLREPTINDAVFNTSGYTITLSGIGFTNTFTTNSNFTLTGTLNLNSALTLGTDSVFSLNGGHLVLQQGGILSGGTVVLNGGSVGSLAGTTLTLDSAARLHGGSGFIGAYSGNANGGSIVNNGIISADLSNQALYIQPGYGNGVNGNQYGTFTSTGTLQASSGGSLYVSPYGGTLGNAIKATGNNSQLFLNGTANLAEGTTFSASNSGKVYLSGNYDSQNHSLLIADGVLSMLGGTLRNSTINLTGNGVGLDFATGSGSLDNVTVNGALNVAGNTAFIYNTLTATNGISVTNGGRLQFQTDSLLKGNALLNSAYMGGYQGTTFRLDSNMLVHGGNGGTLGSYNTTGYGGNLVNNGTISADVSGQTLYVQPGYGNGVNSNQYGTFTSTGTLQAVNGGFLSISANGGGTLSGTITATGTNSQVYLYGSQNLADGTTFSASNNGKIFLFGAYDNGGNTIHLTDGALCMSGGTLRNSTINLSGSGVGINFATGNGTLDNVTINGGLNVASNIAFVYNNLTTTGPIAVTNGGHIQFQTDTTLHSSEVALNNGNVGGYQGTTLTLDSGLLLHGGNNSYVGAYNSNFYGGSLVNNGTISADMAGRSLFVQPGYDPLLGNYGTFTNTGTLQATNSGTLYINNSGGAGTSTGTIWADAGSNIFTSNLTQTAGSTIVNGTLNTGGNIFTLTGGRLMGSGTISGSVQNQGGIVSAGSSPTTAGTLAVTRNYTQDASSVFLVKLGGAAQGVSYDLLQVHGIASLHGQLEVQLLNNFTPYVGETFDILTYGNRTGTFDSLSALNGDSYTLTYNDSNGSATLHFVAAAIPETGTLVSLSLLAFGGLFTLRLRTTNSAQ